MRLKSWITLGVCTAFFGVVAIVGATRAMEIWNRREKVLEQEQVERPEPKKITRTASEPAVTESSSSSSEASPVSEVNWDVPFTSQAPHGDWDEVHKEACEEASILMAIRYFRDQPFASESEADIALDAVLKANTDMGFAIDTTAAEVKELIDSLAPELSTSLLKDPSVEDLQEALTNGALIIVPAQGQYLGNPYFRVPGPRYHMLVLRGFTDDGYVITNDPGTKRGEEFVYDWKTMMNAIHDWNGGDVENGEKVVVVVRS